MSRRTERMAQDAADEASRAALASEAGRVLQQRAQERVEAVEPSTDTDHRPVKSFNKVRDAAMAEIEAREERERVAEPPPPKDFEPPPTQAKEKQETPAETPAPQQAAEPEAPPVEAPPEMVKVKVDGEEFEVPKADIDEAGGIAPYRILRASENRLKRANETLAEVRKLQAAATEQAIRALQPPPPPQITDQQFVQSKLDAIRYGTPEEAATALLEIQNRNVRQAPDPIAIATQATISIKHDMAKAQFQKDFADITSNPMLSELVNVQISKALSPYVQAGQPDWQKLSVLDFGQVFSTIGNQIRAALPRPSQPQPAQQANDTPSQTPEREARKASIVNLPTAAARASPPAEEKPMSYEEARLAALADAAKARGKYVG